MPLPPNAVLYSGLDVDCTTRTGEPVRVHLRLVKISEIGAFLGAAIEDRAALQLCIESPAGLDPDTLDDDSYAKLVEANLELNFSRALAVSRKEMDRAAKTGAGVRGVVENLASLLNKFAPKSPSPAASPASKSSE